MKTKGQRVSKNIVVLPKDPDARPSITLNKKGPPSKDDIELDKEMYRKRKEVGEDHKRQIFEPDETKKRTKATNTYNVIKQNQVTPGSWITFNRLSRKD